MRDGVTYRVDKVFAGTVEERVRDLTMVRIALRLRELVGRPLAEQVVALLELQPLLDEVLPELLRMQRPS